MDEDPYLDVKHEQDEAQASQENCSDSRPGKREREDQVGKSIHIVNYNIDLI